MEELSDATVRTASSSLKTNDQLMREDQDRAYRLSLEADRKKMIERLERERRVKSEIESQAKLKESRIREKKQKLAEWKNKFELEASIAAPDFTISFKAPGNRSFARKFSSQTSVEVFTICFALIYSFL